MTRCSLDDRPPRPTMKPPFSHHIPRSLAPRTAPVSAPRNSHTFRIISSVGMGKLEATATKHDLYLALAFRCAIACFQRSVASRWKIYGGEGRQGRLLSLGRVPDRTRSSAIISSISESRAGTRSDASPRPGPRRTARASRKSPASAMADWAAWPPATWIRWRRSKFRRSATASATSSASSIRRSATAGRWK